jgi:hypothetical protein
MSIKLGLTLREKRKLMILEKGVLRRITGPKRKVAKSRMEIII